METDPCGSCHLRGNLKLCIQRECCFNTNWCAKELRREVEQLSINLARTKKAKKRLESEIRWIENPDRMGK